MLRLPAHLRDARGLRDVVRTMAEFDLIGRIAARAGRRTDVVLGIGDDAALLVPPVGQQLVAACDTLNRGVHFPLDAEPADIGWKALAVNLSDLAAMGATPAWVLLSLALPEADAGFVDAFLDGFFELAERSEVALVGGDTTHGPLSITVIVLGLVPAGAALRRAGARVGDVVCVSGTPGDAAGALQLMDVPIDASDSPHLQALRQRMRRPLPRLDLGIALRNRAHAAIDISDGLLADLGHVARASGVGIELDADALPCSSALAARFEPAERLRLQATGGDDYELAFTLPKAQFDALCATWSDTDVPLTRIGRVLAGAGVVLRDAQGAPIVFERGGWEHFSGAQQ